MNFYEHTIIAKHDLTSSELDGLIKKYSDIISGSSGKVIKLEKWGLINFSEKIENFKKGFYIHLKFEGNNNILEQLKEKIKLDKKVIRDLVVKYNKLDLNNEYFRSNQYEK